MAIYQFCVKIAVDCLKVCEFCVRGKKKKEKSKKICCSIRGACEGSKIRNIEILRKEFVHMPFQVFIA